MAYWQDWFRHRCEGGTDPAAATAALGWPSVAEDAWPEVRDGFVTGLEQLARAVEQLDPDLPITPGFEVPLLDGYTARDVWEHVGQHNAHHLGQVVILRQFLGLWPPPAGSSPGERARRFRGLAAHHGGWRLADWRLGTALTTLEHHRTRRRARRNPPGPRRVQALSR